MPRVGGEALVGRGSVRAGVGASSSAQAELRPTVILNRMEAEIN
jgi:hypothetical protein